MSFFRLGCGIESEAAKFLAAKMIMKDKQARWGGPPCFVAFEAMEFLR
jgi:hypothetical protein